MWHVNNVLGATKNYKKFIVIKIMNEAKFKDIGVIENYKISFKCFDTSDGYQATFHIYDKSNPEMHYQVNFQISGTEYNSDIINSGKSTNIHIKDNYENVENCFKKIGIKYLEEKITINDLKDENVPLIRYLF